MAGNPFINSIIKKNRQGGDPRFAVLVPVGKLRSRTSTRRASTSRTRTGHQSPANPSSTRAATRRGTASLNTRTSRDTISSTLSSRATARLLRANA